jgi:hypothetical protein
MKRMHHLARIALGALALGLVAVPHAWADHRPAIAVPGHPDVPAVVDGYDASYAVVVGEWGLYRPGHVAPTVIRPLVGPAPGYYHPRAFYPGSTPTGYYPSAGRPPRYGRLEVEPPANRTLPPPAQSYRRSWGAESPPVPATEYPSFAPPEVTIEPRRDRRTWRREPYRSRPDRR